MYSKTICADGSSTGGKIFTKENSGHFGLNWIH